MQAAVAIKEEKQSLISMGWIINRKDDLIWFIGSVITSYAFLAANLMLVKLGISVMIMTWIWALGFDGPHVFGTISRTYADSQERRKRAKLYYGSLLLFAIGPLMLLADQLAGVNLLGPIFFFLASMWAYYHLVMQHYGFMILYNKNNSDLAESDHLIDRAFILLGMTYPFVRFLTHSYAAKERLDGIRLSTESGSVWWVETLVFSAFVMSLILFVGRQAQRLYQRQPVNAPKLMLLAACIPMHWIVLRCLEPFPPTAGALAAVATLSIYHKIPYHPIL